MIIWAIVPVKPLRRGKSRLGDIMSEKERVMLNRQLLSHVVTTLQQVKSIEHTLVVSRDPEALSLARDLGARTLKENGSPFLNDSLERAAAFAKVYKVKGILVIPSDLPLLEVEDVEDMIRRANGGPVVAIAPDRHKDGTNALMLSPPNVIPFDYGPGSFHRHTQHARSAGVRLEICECESLSLDLDLPEDLALLSESLDFGLEHTIPML